MCICQSNDNGFFPLNPTLEYSGLEIAFSKTGMIRARHFREYSYDSGINTQDFVNINNCPLCGRELKKCREENDG